MGFKLATTGISDGRSRQLTTAPPVRIIICMVLISGVAQVCLKWFHQAMNYGKGWHNFEDLREGREFQGGGVIATASTSNLEMSASFVYKHGSDACDFQGTIH